jgi:hypothetical protein
VKLRIYIFSTSVYRLDSVSLTDENSFDLESGVERFISVIALRIKHRNPVTNTSASMQNSGL